MTSIMMRLPLAIKSLLSQNIKTKAQAQRFINKCITTRKICWPQRDELVLDIMIISNLKYKQQFWIDFLENWTTKWAYGTSDDSLASHHLSIESLYGDSTMGYDCCNRIGHSQIHTASGSCKCVGVFIYYILLCENHEPNHKRLSG